MSQARENVGQRFTSQLPGSGRNQIDIRMGQKQAHQFLAGVTGSANDRDLCSCHNAQCVFRLARIATNFLVTIKLFALGVFSNFAVWNLFILSGWPFSRFSVSFSRSSFSISSGFGCAPVSPTRRSAWGK